MQKKLQLRLAKFANAGRVLIRRVNAARRFAVEWLRDTPRRFAAKWLRDAAALADFGVSHVVLNGEANVPERRNVALRMCLFARKCCDTCRG